MASGVAALRKGMGIPLYKIPPSYILFMTPKIICSPKATHSRSLSRHPVFLRKQNPPHPQKNILQCISIPPLFAIVVAAAFDYQLCIHCSQSEEGYSSQAVPTPTNGMYVWLVDNSRSTLLDRFTDTDRSSSSGTRACEEGGSEGTGQAKW